MYNRMFTKNIPKSYWYFWWTDPKFIHTVPKIKWYGDENVCEWASHFWKFVNSSLHIEHLYYILLTIIKHIMLIL